MHLFILNLSLDLFHDLCFSTQFLGRISVCSVLAQPTALMTTS